MIISPKERKPSPVARLLSWAGLGAQNERNVQSVVSESQFRLEMEKERSRVDRRSFSSEFAVVLVDGVTLKHISKNKSLLIDLCRRLRITDCVGWCEAKLSFLLPETDRQGAIVVSQELEKIALIHGIKVNVEIVVYPDDDDVASSSSEFLSFQFTKDNDLTPLKMRDENDPECSSAFLVSDIVKSKSQFFATTSPTPFWKRAIDVVGASTGLFLLSPVFAVSAMAVRLSGPGPVFFKQLREGKDGKSFHIYKFRTMVVEAEDMKDDLRKNSEQDGPAFKIKNDPRLTAVGKYLRKSCIDELPQLVNVLNGTMSLVGPRPLPVNESLECMIWQRKRLEVVPGLTCIWQLQGDRNTRFNEWMRMDMEYIRRRSFWFDIKLIAKTVFVAVLHRGSV